MKRIRYILLLFILLIIPINVSADEIDIKSNNAVLYNLNEDKIIYEKNKDEKVLIASLTKIMTTIVSIENIKDLDEKIVLTDNIFDELDNDVSLAGFKRNEEVTYRDLLYGALLPSGADATHSLAYFISGSEEEFVKLMNKKAEDLHLKNTHFTNTIGIETSDNMHYSTVNDMAIILKYALKNKEFKKIFETDVYKRENNTFKSSKKRAEIKKEIDLSIIKGSKTGYTSKAGLCLASIATINNINYLFVTTGAEYQTSSINHFIDHKNVYEYYRDNYSYRRVINKGDTLVKLKTKYKEEVIVKSNENVDLFLKNDLDLDKLEYKYTPYKELKLGIKKNDRIGKLTIKDGENEIYTMDIYSPKTIFYKLSKIEKIAIIVLVLIIFLKLINKKKRRRKRRR